MTSFIGHINKPVIKLKIYFNSHIHIEWKKIRTAFLCDVIHLYRTVAQANFNILILFLYIFPFFRLKYLCTLYIVHIARDILLISFKVMIRLTIGYRFHELFLNYKCIMHFLQFYGVVKALTAVLRFICNVRRSTLSYTNSKITFNFQMKTFGKCVQCLYNITTYTISKIKHQE